MAKDYDLILPLGGSCATAYQLQVRDKRMHSNPFDWLLSEPPTLSKLAECFHDDFRNWMLPENLRRLSPQEMRDGGTPFQYYDEATGYKFIHAFVKPIEMTNGEERGTSLRRISRLCRMLEAANSIMLLYDTECPGAVSHVLKVRDALRSRFGNAKIIDITIWEFNADKREEIITEDGVTRLRFPYPRHDFMYHNRSHEFEIMNHWNISGKVKSDFRGRGKFVFLARNPKGMKLILLRSKKKILEMVLRTRHRKYELFLGGE